MNSSHLSFEQLPEHIRKNSGVAIAPQQRRALLENFLGNSDYIFARHTIGSEQFYLGVERSDEDGSISLNYSSVGLPDSVASLKFNYCPDFEVRDNLVLSSVRGVIWTVTDQINGDCLLNILKDLEVLERS